MTSNRTVELRTPYTFAVLVTILRIHARVAAVGFRELHPDDYLIWLAIVRASSYHSVLWSSTAVD